MYEDEKVRECLDDEARIDRGSKGGSLRGAYDWRADNWHRKKESARLPIFVLHRCSM